jgi:ketosteroid isomerase-like protein
MSTHDIAHDLVALCKAGKFEDAGEKYWADDVRSIEPMGDNSVSEGKQAARKKGEWWVNTHEIYSVDVGGPYVHGDQFVVRFSLDVTNKESGQRFAMDEVGVYTLVDGKISEERFFYGG